MDKTMNVFQYANSCEKTFEANLEMIGRYKRKTMFYADLSIAEYYNEDSVKDTYERVMKEWLDNIEYIVEFVLCLNWKCWEHHGKGNDKLSLLYHDLYYDAVDKVLTHYEGNQEAMEYYYEVLD